VLASEEHLDLNAAVNMDMADMAINAQLKITPMSKSLFRVAEVGPERK
jgi:hypothetical protein